MADPFATAQDLLIEAECQTKLLMQMPIEKMRQEMKALQANNPVLHSLVHKKLDELCKGLIYLTPPLPPPARFPKVGDRFLLQPVGGDGKGVAGKWVLAEVYHLTTDGVCLRFPGGTKFIVDPEAAGYWGWICVDGQMLLVPSCLTG